MTTRDSDSDSDELMPTRDPQLTAALARAITDSEDEGMGVPDVPVMMPSRESSVTPTEDQHDFCETSIK